MRLILQLNYGRAVTIELPVNFKPAKSAILMEGDSLQLFLLLKNLSRKAALSPSASLSCIRKGAD